MKPMERVIRAQAKTLPEVILPRSPEEPRVYVTAEDKKGEVYRFFFFAQRQSVDGKAVEFFGGKIKPDKGLIDGRSLGWWSMNFPEEAESAVLFAMDTVSEVDGHLDVLSVEAEAGVRQ